MAENTFPLSPGYYWAQWRIATDETHEGDELTPSTTWEIVQVVANKLDWAETPEDLEALYVSIPGVREAQWRDQFVWGAFVAELDPPEHVATQPPVTEIPPQPTPVIFFIDHEDRTSETL